MRRKSAKINLFDQDKFSMVSDWTDLIELQPNRQGLFSVIAKKYCRDVMPRWFEIDKYTDLQNPMAVYAAVEKCAELLGVDFYWPDAKDLISAIDWLTAAVIACNLEYEIPSLPKTTDLLLQRSYKKLGKVKISIKRGDLLYDLHINLEQWIRILNGESYNLATNYSFDGSKYTAYWDFDSNRHFQ